VIRCHKCQAETPADSVYCPNCGARLDMQYREEADSPAGASDPSEAASEGPTNQAAERLKEKVGNAREDTAEETLWEGGFSSRAMTSTWLLCAAVTVVLVAIVAVWLNASGYWIALLIGLVVLWGSQYARYLYRRMSVRYRLTNHRFFHERGILKRTTDRIEVIDMDDITFQQGIVERMVDVGSILITSSDRTHPELKLEGIANVKEVSEQIDSARRAERMKRGLHIEQI